MSDKTSLQEVLQTLDPVLSPKSYVYVGIADQSLLKVFGYDPFAFYRDAEGITLILRKEDADNNLLKYDGVFCKISFNVEFSSECAGLTAILSSALAKAGIGIKPIHTAFKGHVLVKQEDAHTALEILTALQAKIQGLSAH